MPAMTELLFSYGTLRDRHPILRPSDRADAGVDSMVFEVSESELLAADDYEVDDYQRITVPLRSGRHAWVYVFAG